jgi:rfaE bifunctional protein kinase chain/domain
MQEQPARELKRLVALFDDTHVLLIGDTIVDVYVYGTVLGTSAETPTIVARELDTQTYLGGAFLVARHLLELGAHVQFVTLLGDDEMSRVVTSFSHPKFTLVPIHDAGRKTTVKKRFWVDGYKLLQFDQLDNRPFTNTHDFATIVAERVPRSEVVVISDYRHGLLTPQMIGTLLQAVKNEKKLSYVDSQVSQSVANHTLYRGADVICLNLKEARAIDPAFEVPADGAMGNASPTLIDRLGIANVVVKLGDKGAMGWLSGRFVRSEALNVRVVDTCGAGDAFLAAFCLAGLRDPAMSLAVANHWAGLATTIQGTRPPARRRLLESFGIDAPEAAE